MYVHTIYLNKTIIVSIVQQNLDCNLHENGVIFLWIIVSIVQQNLPSNLHENGVTFLLIIVSIVHQTFWQKATFKYSDSL